MKNIKKLLTITPLTVSVLAPAAAMNCLTSCSNNTVKHITEPTTQQKRKIFTKDQYASVLNATYTLEMTSELEAGQQLILGSSKSAQAITVTDTLNLTFRGDIGASIEIDKDDHKKINITVPATYEAEAESKETTPLYLKFNASFQCINGTSVVWEQEIKDFEISATRTPKLYPSQRSITLYKDHLWPLSDAEFDIYPVGETAFEDGLTFEIESYTTKKVSNLKHTGTPRIEISSDRHYFSLITHFELESTTSYYGNATFNLCFVAKKNGTTVWSESVPGLQVLIKPKS